MLQVTDELSYARITARGSQGKTPREGGGGRQRGWEEGRKAQGGREGGREGGLQQLILFNWFCRSPIGKESVVHAPVRRRSACVGACMCTCVRISQE
jgi:hypothetical protein